MKWRRVIIESPYTGDVEGNLAYVRLCMRDCLLRGDAPIASHALYTQEGVLDDNIPEERQMGIEAGLIWGALADVTVVYTDYGFSNGMNWGIKRAEEEGRPVEYRQLFTKSDLAPRAEILEKKTWVLSGFEVTNLHLVARGISFEVILKNSSTAVRIGEDAQSIARVIECLKHHRPVPLGIPGWILEVADDFIRMAKSL